MCLTAVAAAAAAVAAAAAAAALQEGVQQQCERRRSLHRRSARCRNAFSDGSLPLPYMEQVQRNVCF